MKVYKYCLIAVVLGPVVAWGQIGDIPRGRTEEKDGMEVLTRGPVHEAFAETVTFDPEPGIVTPKAPPAAIEELPPEQRPEGANVAWIPGYWAWDDERTDFLWVSGIWRALPPGRQWVPGYWGRAGEGAQWTSGYWADSEASEAEYLPEPPATVEVGPNVTAPSADHIWLPGCWLWQQNRYAWRPGYWAAGHSDWDWVPAHYVWTPRGYVFVDGYYDYTVARRGVLFAPVYFNSSVYSRRGFSYAPAIVINPAVFASHLFLRPRYGHYYFGDYYGSNYTNAGFSSWFSYHSSHRGYDPIYAHQRWRHRDDSGWEQRAEANFRHLRDNKIARPPHNWSAQRELAGRADSSNRRNIVVAAQLEELDRRKGNQLRFQPVDPAERQKLGRQGQEYRMYLQQRQQLEANAERTPGGDPASDARPTRRTFSRSPFVAPPADQLGKKNKPPQRHQVLKPNFEVQPQPRNRGQGQPQRRGANQGSRPGAGGSAGPSQRQRASREPSQDAQRNQSKGKSQKEKQKD